MSLVHSEMRTSMKLVTFNIRCDCGVDQENNFEFRKPIILKKLIDEQPDIICFQEVMSHVADWLNHTLTEYIVVGCGRDANLEGEQVSIAFKKEVFSLLSLHHFWHSTTPAIPGSVFENQSVFPRLCTDCVLMDRQSKQVIRVVNTHLDHMNSEVRSQELKLIMNKISEKTMYQEEITYFMGDLNAEPDSEEMKIMSTFNDFKCLTNDIGLTYHGYFKDNTISFEHDGPQIDYIYVRGHVTLESVEKWQDCIEGVYLSDHYPIMAIVK